MSKQDEAKCNHPDRMQVIVTNQPDAYDKTRSHASTWVCADPACVVDAMGWVMRFTGEKAWWRIGVDGVWRESMYPSAS